MSKITLSFTSKDERPLRTTGSACAEVVKPKRIWRGQNTEVWEADGPTNGWPGPNVPTNNTERDRERA